MAEPHSKLKCENDAVVRNDRDDNDSFPTARWRKIVEQPTSRRNEKIFVDERATLSCRSSTLSCRSSVASLVNDSYIVNRDR